MHYNTVITQKYSVQSYVHILVNGHLKIGFEEFSMVNALVLPGREKDEKKLEDKLALSFLLFSQADITLHSFQSSCFANKPDRKAVQVAKSPNKLVTKQIVLW